jgi:hypothetical protein
VHPLGRSSTRSRNFNRASGTRHTYAPATGRKRSKRGGEKTDEDAGRAVRNPLKSCRAAVFWIRSCALYVSNTAGFRPCTIRSRNHANSSRPPRINENECGRYPGSYRGVSLIYIGGKNSPKLETCIDSLITADEAGMGLQERTSDGNRVDSNGHCCIVATTGVVTSGGLGWQDTKGKQPAIQLLYFTPKCFNDYSVLIESSR